MVSKSLVLLSTLALAGSILVPLAAARRGAPTICFPVRVDESYRFVVDSGASDADGTPARDLLAVTLATLDKESSALARMETLRRACLRLEHADDRSDLMRTLLDTLQQRVLDAEAATDAPDRRARVWFDLGYAHAILTDFGAVPDSTRADHATLVARTTRYLDKALASNPTDAQMHVGAAFAHAKQSAARDVPYFEHLLAAWTSSDRLARLNVEDALRHFDPDLLAQAAEDVTRNLEQALARATKELARSK
ncbi:MAG: hypothetical protein JNL94_13355 [Planctomycetes bacterium]|nr:hypothetical protein [Planctomycetota bacterium]